MCNRAMLSMCLGFGEGREVGQWCARRLPEPASQPARASLPEPASQPEPACCIQFLWLAITLARDLLAILPFACGGFATGVYET